MKTFSGTYYNGELKLDKPLKTKKPVRVILTIEDENLPGLNLADFSFEESRELLKDLSTSFSDEVVKERRKEV